MTFVNTKKQKTMGKCGLVLKMLKKSSRLSSLTENKILGKYLQNRSCIVFAEALDLHNNHNIHIDRQNI